MGEWNEFGAGERSKNPHRIDYIADALGGEVVGEISKGGCWTCFECEPAQHGCEANQDEATAALHAHRLAAHSGRSATPGPTRPDPSLTERQLWGDGSTDA